MQVNSYFQLIEMEAATPRGLAGVLCTESEAAGARALDPGLSVSEGSGESLALWKASDAMEINYFICKKLDMDL